MSDTLFAVANATMPTASTGCSPTPADSSNGSSARRRGPPAARLLDANAPQRNAAGKARLGWTLDGLERKPDLVASGHERA